MSGRSSGGMIVAVMMLILIYLAAGIATTPDENVVEVECPPSRCSSECTLVGDTCTCIAKVATPPAEMEIPQATSYPDIVTCPLQCCLDEESDQ